MKKFALIGAAGYIAKRHVEAIKSINGNLIMMCDPNDIYDSYGLRSIWCMIHMNYD